MTDNMRKVDNGCQCTINKICKFLMDFSVSGHYLLWQHLSLNDVIANLNFFEYVKLEQDREVIFYLILIIFCLYFMMYAMVSVARASTSKLDYYNNM